MHPFQRRRGLSSVMFSPVSLHLKYCPNSFILVNRGLTLSAIVVTVAGSAVGSSPSFTSNICDANFTPALRLTVRHKSVIFVFILQSSNCCLQRFCIYHTRCLIQRGPVTQARSPGGLNPQKHFSKNFEAIFRLTSNCYDLLTSVECCVQSTSSVNNLDVEFVYVFVSSWNFQVVNESLL